MYVTGSCGILLIIWSFEWYNLNSLKFSISYYLLAISVLFGKLPARPRVVIRGAASWSRHQKCEVRAHHVKNPPLTESLASPFFSIGCCARLSLGGNGVCQTYKSVGQWWRGASITTPLQPNYWIHWEVLHVFFTSSTNLFVYTRSSQNLWQST